MISPSLPRMRAAAAAEPIPPGQKDQSHSHRPADPSPPVPDRFLWATGIEDTFIIDPWPATGRTLEEYELTRHYDLWREDIERMASLGVPAVRYGIPWYRIQPAPNRWDWSFPDRVLPALREHGLEILLDLVHYGTPAWLEGAFTAPDYALRVAEYAAAVAQRYRELIRWFTPLNEPRITAWYTGRVGRWPPYLQGWSGFVSVMLRLCEGICRTSAALRAVQPDTVLLHVDATDQYVTDDPALAGEAHLRQQIGFLALDLVSGRVDERHPLWGWLRRRGFTPEQAAWFRANRAPLDVVGVNMYPMYSLKRLVRTRQGLRQRMPYAPPSVLRNLLTWYAERYGRPVLITETAARGPVWRRARWLDSSIQVVRQLREAGLPIVGYTWWPMYGLVSWPYRTGHRPAAHYVEQMGLWDLRPDETGALSRREETALVARYREYVRRGSEAVGRSGTQDSATVGHR